MLGREGVEVGQQAHRWEPTATPPPPRVASR
jgi:hypothetical protein